MTNKNGRRIFAYGNYFTDAGVAFVSCFEVGSRTFIFNLTNTAADALSDAKFELPDRPSLLYVSGSSFGNSVQILLLLDGVLCKEGVGSTGQQSRVQIHA